MLKLSDKQFWDILRENGGLYARTARAIEKQFNIEYSRQAVRHRAEMKPELLEDILEQNTDIAEEGLFSLMRSSDARVRTSNIQFYLKTKGKKRGYIERQEFDNMDAAINLEIKTKDKSQQKNIEELM